MASPLDLPESVTRRARALAAGEVTPVPARDAATVVLLRDDNGALEVFLMRRAPSLAFAAGMHVFPGGAVDEADLEADSAGLDADALARALTASPEAAVALVVAAARETEEEAGVRVPVGDLLPWTHWVTPEAEERRFDTRFFVAALPEGHVADSVTGESDHARWIAPAEALAERAAGRLPMLPPTAATLAELAEHASVGEVLAAASARRVRPLMPRAFVADDAIEWRIVDAVTGEVLA